MEKILSNKDLLSLKFLDIAKEFQANVELIKVLKSRTYHIGSANVLIRASSDGNNRYFFGINYITIEEIANLENPFIAFICGAVESINNTNDDNKLKKKQTLGYIEKIEVNTDSLVKEITKNTTNTINNTSKK